MSLNVQYQVHEFFEIKTNSDRNDVFNPPQCGKYMSKERFQRTLQCLRKTNNPPPAYLNWCWMIRDMVKSFNDNMETVHDPSCIICLDELMVLSLKKFCLNWVYVKYKPHPFGNEYPTIAC